MDYKEIIKERILVLPEDLRDLILEESWRETLKKISDEFDLSEADYVTLENEVFLVLSLFQAKSDFLANIQQNIDLDQKTAGWLLEDIENQIFNQVSRELEKIDLLAKTEQNITTSNNIGSSFEQIILNQARAMQPARNTLANETVEPTIQSNNKEVAGQNTSYVAKENTPPANLPTEAKEQGVIHNYIGKDPYREPIE